MPEWPVGGVVDGHDHLAILLDPDFDAVALKALSEILNR